MERRTFLGRMAVVSTPLVAGCSGGNGGDGGDGGDGDGPSPAGSPTPSPTERPPSSPTGSPTSTLTDSPTPPPTADPSGSPTERPTPSPTATETEIPGAQEEFQDYSWGKLEGVDPVSDASIRMRNTEFHPLVAAVEPGTELTVTNEDSHGHTFTVPRLDVSERLGGGDGISVTVERTGTFDYVCTFHPPDMLGRLVVTESASTVTPTPTPTLTPTETETETTTEEDDGYY